MRIALFSAALIGIVSAAPASYTPDPHVLHEKRDAVPVAWTHHSRAGRSTVLPVRIGLKQRNLEHGSSMVADVADPDSPNFGKHWTAEKVANMFAPSRETSDKTVEWLVASGVDSSRLKHSVGK